jgi:hypothetical protein
MQEYLFDLAENGLPERQGFQPYLQTMKNAREDSRASHNRSESQSIRDVKSWMRETSLLIVAEKRYFIG